VATVDLGSAAPAPASLLDALPRRLSLTLPELRVVAEHAGGAPLPFDASVHDPAAATGTAAAADAAGAADAADSAALAAAIDSLHDPRSSLARRGLLVDTVLDEGLLGAVGLLATPAVALDLDVAVGESRVRAWHRQQGGAVAALATADGVVFELAWFPVERWAEELARVAVVPEELPLRPSGVPGHLDLPYALADAVAEAVHCGRADLLPVLVADHAASTTSRGRAVPDTEVAGLLTALATEARGRLRALVADVSGDRTAVVGVVSWVLVADGWRALRPRCESGVDHVTVEAVEPADLAAQLAPVLAEVAR